MIGHIMISLASLGKHIGERVLFTNVNLTIGIADRIGLVGPNGSGKTTLLEILAGRLEPDEGEVSRNRRATVGYLLQEVPKFSGRTLIDELLAGHESLDKLGAQLRLVEEEVRRASDEDELEELALRHGELERLFDSAGGYDLPSAGKKILGGLGFKSSDFDRNTEEFSGGWLMRLALARLLLTEPSLLLLDEPTNYLDLESVTWLESYLRDYQGSLIIVAHDRTLLNTISGRIWEIDEERIISYTGNYDSYLRARALREEGLAAQRKSQERFLVKEKRFIERFRYKNTKAKAVQSRIKRLEKMDFVGESARRRNVSIAIPDPPPSARVQLELTDLWKSYDDLPIYTGIDFQVERGDRIALVGPNGAGKSTLMKIISGALGFEKGSRTLGRGVELSYYAQHQVEILNYESTILDEVGAAAPGVLVQQVRSLLGRFLFTKEDVFKKISVLSGGEKARVALAKLLISPPNLILFDEPTSHLDIGSREILAGALKEYSGSLVIISHDRHFLDAIVTRVVEVGNGGIQQYLGSYSDYLRKKEQGPDSGDPSGGAGGKTGRKSRLKDDRRVEAEKRNELYRKLKPIKQEVAVLEEEISEAESKISGFEEKMADPAFYEDGARFAEALRDYNELKAVALSKTERWEELGQQMEELAGDGDQP